MYPSVPGTAGSQGGCAARVAKLATPTGRMHSTGYLRKTGVAGRLLVDPYRAYALIQVLAEIRGYGRMLSAPTERVLFILLYVLKSNLSY